MTDHTFRIDRLPDDSGDMEAYAAWCDRVYQDALRRSWKARPAPLAVDGRAYHLRRLARRRRRNG